MVKRWRLTWLLRQKEDGTAWGLGASRSHTDLPLSLRLPLSGLLTSRDWQQVRRLTSSSWRLLSPCCCLSAVYPKHPKGFTLLRLLFSLSFLLERRRVREREGAECKLLGMDLCSPPYIWSIPVILAAIYGILLLYLDSPFPVGGEVALTEKRWANIILF